MNNIEEKFFKAFGVEKGMYCYYCDDGFNCFKQKCRHPLYPPITPEFVLKLIQIILNYIDKNSCEPLHIRNDQLWFDFYSASGKNIKECTLLLCIELKDEIQQEVQEVI